eukprot:1658999-Amphidinium_carterae.2
MHDFDLFQVVNTAAFLRDRLHERWPYTWQMPYSHVIRSFCFTLFIQEDVACKATLNSLLSQTFNGSVCPRHCEPMEKKNLHWTYAN